MKYPGFPGRSLYGNCPDMPKGTCCKKTHRNIGHHGISGHFLTCTAGPCGHVHGSTTSEGLGFASASGSMSGHITMAVAAVIGMAVGGALVAFLQRFYPLKYHVKTH